MVCLYLHAEGKGEEDGSEDGFIDPKILHFVQNDRLCFILSVPFVILSVSEGSQCRLICEYEAGKHPWEVGDSLHLGVVTGGDYLEIV